MIISHYFKVFIRNLRKNFSFSFINIFGLTLGFIMGIIILSYLVNELSYEKYINDSDRIYRVYREMHFNQGSIASDPSANAPMGPYLKENFPEVESQTRISKKEKVLFVSGEETFEEEMHYADRSFFSLFNQKIIYGNPEMMFSEPWSIVITKKVANKYFGNQNPLGKTMNTRDGKIFTVTGVIEDLPYTTHLRFNILASFSSLTTLKEYNDEIDGWGIQYRSFHTYIKIREGYTTDNIENNFEKISKSYLSANPFIRFQFSLQAIPKIYLYYNGGGSLTRIYLFAAIGFLILLIPCINYINLNTAESVKRLKEIGLRKVVGARKIQLIGQFLLESVFISTLSLVLAITLAEIILPVFNNIMQKHLSFQYLNHWKLSLGYLCIGVISGFLAGLYPAYYLSGFKPTEAIWGKFSPRTDKAYFRNASVILQFAISVFLLCSTGVILLQLYHNNHADLGFNKDKVLAVGLGWEEQSTKIYAARDELARIPGVQKTSLTSAAPFIHTTFGYFMFEGKEEKDYSEIYQCDENFFDLMGFRILKGRGFNPDLKTEQNHVIINETLAKRAGWQNPLGKTFHPLETDSIQYEVIGIMQDFHRSSFHNTITPCFLNYTSEPEAIKMIILQLHETKSGQILFQVDSLIEAFYPEADINPVFIEDEIAKEYQEDKRTGEMFIYFTFLAIFITIIGLYGLSLFVIKQKTKEIGIRKVFGSDVFDIIRILTLKFTIIILLSIIIGLPAAIIYSKKWLQNFIYQADNIWMVYFAAIICILILASLTVIFQSLKAAKENPLKALKYE